MKSSFRSHPNSNLNKDCVAIKDDSPEFNSRGVWSDTFLVRACTVVSGYFSSHSIVIRIQSSFLKAGVAKLFAHVYFLPDICISFKFKPSMMTLNKKNHLTW
jgi:hypothetical protein